jgi:ATP-dependent DNA helicase DinG
MTAAELLGAEGPLAASLPGFAPRAVQQALARAVEAALDGQGLLVAEAGTGTGKTYAYLAPALFSGRKVVISTGTRTLQDQLYHQDLPALARALGRPLRSALLKGRSNYLCVYRLRLWRDDPAAALEHGREGLRQLQIVADWAAGTRRGDIAECAALPEEARLWRDLTSTADNCLGSDCPDFSVCHVVKARREAQEADLVVINHHLFCADLQLKEGGFGDFLPDADAIIFDEAHQLPEVAAGFFGQALSSRALQQLAREAVKAVAQEAVEASPEMNAAAHALENALSPLRTALGPAQRRLGWEEVASQRDFAAALSGLDGQLGTFTALLEGLAERGKQLHACHVRALDSTDRLALMQGGGEACSPDDAVRWIETTRAGFVLRRTPLDIAPQFRAHLLARPRAHVFTSATLAVGGSFAHFTRQLGLEDYAGEQLDSPFDYAGNALLYLPPGMPDPNTPGYTDAVLRQARDLLDHSEGRAFLLFTSHRALQHAAAVLRAAHLPWPLLVQGDAPRTRLLDEFRAAGNAVLLGAASFWEGVDVPGPALSLVLIDKLPFAAPGDPVMLARLRALEQAGLNPFMDYQVPAAVMALKQGVGRLIRGPRDRGVLALCDPRLTQKAYGRIFLDSLPPIPRTRHLTAVAAFFQEQP